MLDLDSISIPISFEGFPVHSKSRTKSNDVFTKPLLIERKRHPYSSGPNTHNIVQEPQFKRPNASHTIHYEKERDNANHPRSSTTFEYEKSEPRPDEQLDPLLAIKLEPKSEGEDYPDPKALLERLKVYGMKEKTAIRGNGNCQFAAFSDQCFGDIKYAAAIRSECVRWLAKNKDFVLSNGAKMEDFLQTDYFPTWQDYCEYMSEDGIWGDNLTLVALSELFRTKIIIISSIKLSKNQNPCTVIIPSNWDNKKVVYLSHLHELHYSSICPDDETVI